MGRLTLNVLLSFAQFEREVTGERIRDKIAASKKKGLWMGGPVPLGYQVIERRLVPVPEEAKRVRTIMRRYVASSSANELIAQLQAEGIVTKVQYQTSGPHRGGIPFRRGSLFHLLKNPVYRGKIVHKGKVYDGEHEAVVDEALWQQVQERLMAKAPPRRRPTNDPQQAMLRGLLTDPEGRPMVPTYGAKGTRRYSYYETRKDLARPVDPPSTRFQRGALERHVLEHVASLLDDEHALRRMARLDEAEALRTLFTCAGALRSRLNQSGESSEVLRSLIALIKVQRDRLELTLRPGALGCDGQPGWHWSIPLPARKPFREAKLRIDAAPGGAEPDPQLIELLRDALDVQKLVLASPERSINQLSQAVGRCRKQMAKLFRISWLSPRIVESIIDGEQPKTLSRARLLDAELPVDWTEQAALFGLPS